MGSGDRVRHSGRMGFIGFHNDEGALVHLGREDPRRFYCGWRNVQRGACGGSRGSGVPCDSCRRFKEDNAELLAATANPKLLHVEFDHGEPRRALLLAHELEKASSILGVHRQAWNGAAFVDGDSLTVENGVVTHKRLGKIVALAYGFKPLLLSTLPNARVRIARFGPTALSLNGKHKHSRTRRAPLVGSLPRWSSCVGTAPSGSGARAGVHPYLLT